MNFAGNFLLKVAQSPGCVRGLIRLHLSYCTMRTMFWLKELKFYFNQFCGGVSGTSMAGSSEHECFALFFYSLFIVQNRSQQIINYIRKFCANLLQYNQSKYFE